MIEPDELLCVGRTNGAYGVRGSIRIVPFEGGEVLAETKRWFLTPLRGEPRELKVTSLKVHGNMLLATVEGCEIDAEIELRQQGEGRRPEGAHQRSQIGLSRSR